MFWGNNFVDERCIFWVDKCCCFTVFVHSNHSHVRYTIVARCDVVLAQDYGA